MEADVYSLSAFYTHSAKTTLPQKGAAYPCPSPRPGLINLRPLSLPSPQLTEDEGAACLDAPVPQEMLETPELKATLMPQKSAVHRLKV